MQVDDETDVEEEFMSAVSCMSSPASSGGYSSAVAKISTSSSSSYRPQQQQQQKQQRSSESYKYIDCSSSTASEQDQSILRNVGAAGDDEDEDDDDDSGRTVRGEEEERRKLLRNTSEAHPTSNGSNSESQNLKSRLSSPPPELVVEDHSRLDLLYPHGSPGSGLTTSSSLHLNIPSGKKTPTRRSSSGSAISDVGSSRCSSSSRSYHSAKAEICPSPLVNGSVKNEPEVHGPRGSITSRSGRVSTSVAGPLFDEWHPSYSKPPRVTHPLQENVLLSLLNACATYAGGLCIGLPLTALLLAWTCLVIPLRILFYLVTRLTVRGLWRWLRRKEHCDPLWPLGGSRDAENGCESAILLATMQGVGLDASRIRQLLWRKLINLKDANGYLTFAKLSSKVRQAEEECYGGCCAPIWTQDARFDMKTHVTTSRCADDDVRVDTLRDLETYLNRLVRDSNYELNTRRPLWDVRALTDFGSSGAPEMRCTLLIIRIHSALTDGCLCPAKFLSLINDGQLSFDCEPRMRGDDWPSFNLLITASFHLWHAFSVVGAGPIALLAAALRPKMNPVWNVVRTPPSRCDEEAGCAKSGIRVTWARVPQADQLMKLERILRCSIQELLLTFVAGALRRHFRSRGVKHPPDLWTSVPVTFRDYMPVGRNLPCRFVLTPVLLPLSVDGTIPRVWETQRRLCESLDSAYPRTIRCLTRSAGASLPKSFLRSMVARTHGASDGFVCFWRASGDLSFSDRQIHSLLIYPPLGRPSFFGAQHGSKYGFTFVQTGNEIVLSLAIDQNAFGADPDFLLRQFQSELHGLLGHMSTRMLTLSQATFLPSPLLITRLVRSPLKIASQASSQAAASSDGAKAKTTRGEPDEEPSVASADSETLEELEQLMASVQNELQAMKTNPRGNRGDYITKLAELETKMETFHLNIVEKLNKRQRNRSSSTVSEGGLPTSPQQTSYADATDEELKMLLDPNWEALLQPLRADVDELMTEEAREGVMKLRRKRSRRLDSPTRLSPRNSQKRQSPLHRQQSSSTPPSSEIL